MFPRILESFYLSKKVHQYTVPDEFIYEFVSFRRKLLFALSSTLLREDLVWHKPITQEEQDF